MSYQHQQTNLKRYKLIHHYCQCAASTIFDLVRLHHRYISPNTQRPKLLSLETVSHIESNIRLPLISLHAICAQGWLNLQRRPLTMNINIVDAKVQSFFSTAKAFSNSGKQLIICATKIHKSNDRPIVFVTDYGKSCLMCISSTQCICLSCY